MLRVTRHEERHRVGSLGSLRAAVLGADDGIVSTASLVLGVAASSSTGNAPLVAGLAGLVAGSMSMAAGEWVSVSSQRDAERAALDLERRELAGDPTGELDELKRLLAERGIRDSLIDRVAEDLTAKDALAAHAREELDITVGTRARPGRAAVASALSFALGAALPLLALVFAPKRVEVVAVVAASIVSLGLLGWLGARAGGATPLRAVARVVIGGVAAMAVTALIGRLTATAGL